MTSRKDEELWKAELESIAVSYKNRRTEFEKELRDAYLKAEQRASEMETRTVERFKNSQQAELDAYETETQRLLQEAEDRWNSRCAEVRNKSMGDELREAMSAIFGERNRRDD
jgi:hypothetical protein